LGELKEYIVQPPNVVHLVARIGAVFAPVRYAQTARVRSEVRRIPSAVDLPAECAGYYLDAANHTEGQLVSSRAGRCSAARQVKAGRRADRSGRRDET